MNKRLLKSPLALGLATVLCGLALPSTLQAQTSQVLAGYNCFDTDSGTTYAGTSWQGVPLGTFNFGSGPLSVGATDTIVQRLGPTVTTPGGTMAIQVDALQLQTTTPVSLGGGPVGYYYATLNTSFANTGVLTVDSFPTSSANPGTFHDYFTVNFDIRYGSVNGPIVLPAGSPGTVLTLDCNALWQTFLPDPPPSVVHRYPATGDPTDLHIVHVDPSDVSVNEANFFFPIPEPSGLALLGMGALCLAIKTRWGRK
jgi:hypothetical protein